MYRAKIIVTLSIIFIFCSVWDNSRNLWEYSLNQGNVNKNYLAVDTVWYNPENCYHNDVLINTLL